jgi:hypothetical protein
MAGDHERTRFNVGYDWIYACVVNDVKMRLR